jgi:glycosyltransferase involved in cell wall biosynthesis
MYGRGRTLYGGFDCSPGSAGASPDDGEASAPMTENTLYMVIPCYNEEEALRRTAAAAADKLRSLMQTGKASRDSRVLFVDDGSSDGTWEAIRSLCASSGIFAGAALSRNCGHQSALLAGLLTARGRADAAISLDADLQDDINAVDAMVDAFLRGCDVVYGVRSSRGSDTFFKRVTAESYYRLQRALGCEIVFNHADYRLLSARALDALSEYGERDIYLRGIVPMLGLKTASVSYERGERLMGESKYTLKKMLTLASDGVMTLSLAPARIVLGIGGLCLAAAIAALIVSLGGVFFGRAMTELRVITISIWGVGGLILLGVGITGEYAGRAYRESKRRPRYFISETAGLEIQNRKNTGEPL